MITWEEAIDRALWLQEHGRFETIPLHKLAERLQDLEKMCETFPVITPDKDIVTNIDTGAVNVSIRKD